MQTSSCCKSNFCRIQSATLHGIQMSRRDGLCHDSSHLQTCKLLVQQQVRHEREFNLTIQMAWTTSTHHDFIHRALVALYICNSCPWNVTWNILSLPHDCLLSYPQRKLNAYLWHAFRFKLLMIEPSKNFNNFMHESVNVHANQFSHPLGCF